MAVLMTPPYLTFFDNSTPGIPLAGGLIYTYAAGTTTPKATFTDNTEGVLATNPIVLDAQGRATPWISGSYKFVIKDALGNLIRTVDGVTSYSIAAAAANAYFQTFSGDASTTVFTASQDLGTDAKSLFIYVDAGGGKGYEPINPNAYTINGTVLTFSLAPAAGTNNIYVRAPLTLLNAASAAAAAAATSETNAAASAVLASQWASLTSGIVATTDYSAKAWAIGGVGVTGVAAKGAAKEWATLVSGAVDTSGFSSKAWAVGGTGVTTSASGGAAKEWATTTGGAVDTSEFSAKEYATGTTATLGSAKSWATKTTGLVATTDGSAKAWAIGGTGVSTTASAGASKEWAITTGAAVDTTEYSAKEYALGTTVAVGSAKSWATLTSAAVAGGVFSAKEYAQGTQAATGGSSKNWAQQTGADVTGASANSRSAKSWAQDNNTGATLGGSAKDWAQSASLPDGTSKSAKSYAADAAASAVSAASIAAGINDTSTTSLLIATGAKTFTVSAGKLFAAGQFISAISAANSANYMHGTVTSYTGTSLVTNITDIGGSGTKADWNISISGSQGSTGAAGTVTCAAATGTVDAITATYTTPPTLSDLQVVTLISSGANTSTTPSFAPNSLTAHTITARGGAALVAGDTGAAGYLMILEYNLANTRWELANPAKVRLIDIINSTQILDGGTVAGTANAITLTPTQALAAYVAKTTYSFIPGATNTSGTVTAAVSGLATRNIKKNIGGGVALLGVGDIVVSRPAIIYDDGTQFILMNPMQDVQGADIASATTTSLDAATGSYVNITGTTTITAITLAQGREMTVKFAGILTFTNGASLILPGGANITTAAGDTAILRGEASGVVRCISYNKASGTAVVSAGGSELVLLATATAATSATFDFTSLMSSAYSMYRFVFQEMLLTANLAFQVKFSADNGSTWVKFQDLWGEVQPGSSAAAPTYTNSTGVAGSILPAPGFVVTFSGYLDFYNSTVGMAGGYNGYIAMANTNAGSCRFMGRNGNQDTGINAIRFLTSTSNIASGKIFMYGVKNT